MLEGCPPGSVAVDAATVLRGGCGFRLCRDGVTDASVAAAGLIAIQPAPSAQRSASTGAWLGFICPKQSPFPDAPATS